MSQPPIRSSSQVKNTRLALVCAGVFFGMVGMAFASVPLYRAFCQATGFDGTPKRVAAASAVVVDKAVTVRFDANVHGLAWTFAPIQGSQTAKLGETKLAFFRASNTGTVPVTGRAVFNVLPQSAGLYFSKLECFCFKNQTIQPGQTVEFPVVYFVDPRYASDPDTRGQPEITLSYTFLPAADPAQAAQTAAAKPVSALGGAPRAGL
jgi:cytochrome c oxidase assembly protein subunit 11